MTVLAAVPIKPFDSAKKRLEGHLSVAQRRFLAQHLAERALASIAATGAEPLVLAADEEVASFAEDRGYGAKLDRSTNLNASASGAVALASAGRRPWLVIHADLPFIDAAAVEVALEVLAKGGPVIAPSPDGGTPVLGWNRNHFVFEYGPASFHRHQRRLAPHDPIVLTDFRLVFDIDRPADLALVLANDSELTDRLSTLVGS
jgi:2-phospho-L-lactate guanylyltransferase